MPIQGTFTLTYNSKTTEALSYDIDADTLKSKIVGPTGLGLDYSIEVSESGRGYDGKQFIIHFYKMAGDIALITSNFGLLTGGQASTSPSIIITEKVKGSTNLIYSPIPGDMLYSAVSKHQVTVEVNTVRATCPLFNCDFELKLD